MDVRCVWTSADLRTVLASALAMPVFFLVREQLLPFYLLTAVVLVLRHAASVFASTTADLYGTKNLGMNYGVLFSAGCRRYSRPGNRGTRIRAVRQLPLRSLRPRRWRWWRSCRCRGKTAAANGNQLTREGSPVWLTGLKARPYRAFTPEGPSPRAVQTPVHLFHMSSFQSPDASMKRVIISMHALILKHRQRHAPREEHPPRRGTSCSRRSRSWVCRITESLRCTWRRVKASCRGSSSDRPAAGCRPAALEARPSPVQRGAPLDPAIVSAPEDASVVDEDRPDRDATFAKPGLGFRDGGQHDASTSIRVHFTT
jgi:hypothetical protein